MPEAPNVFSYKERQKLRRALILYAAAHSSPNQKRISNYRIANEINAFAEHRYGTNLDGDRYTSHNGIRDFIENKRETRSELLYIIKNFLLSRKHPRFTERDLEVTDERINLAWSLGQYYQTQNIENIKLDTNQDMYWGRISDTAAKETLEIGLIMKKAEPLNALICDMVFVRTDSIHVSKYKDIPKQWCEGVAAISEEGVSFVFKKTSNNEPFQAIGKPISENFLNIHVLKNDQERFF
jgi:hypothetical protein